MHCAVASELKRQSPLRKLGSVHFLLRIGSKTLAKRASWAGEVPGSSKCNISTKWQVVIAKTVRLMMQCQAWRRIVFYSATDLKWE